MNHAPLAPPPFAIAKPIAESHGGVIGCRSALGEGTEVFVRLPISRAQPFTPNTAFAQERSWPASIRALLGPAAATGLLRGGDRLDVEQDVHEDVDTDDARVEDLNRLRSR